MGFDSRFAIQRKLQFSIHLDHSSYFENSPKNRQIHSRDVRILAGLMFIKVAKEIIADAIKSTEVHGRAIQVYASKQ